MDFLWGGVMRGRGIWKGGHDDGDGRRVALMICWACAFHSQWI